jgi:polysaccharide export outer membrane protein
MAAQKSLILYEIKIQPDDLLMIIVSAEDPEISMPLFKSVSVQNPGRLDAAIGQNHAIVSVDADGFRISCFRKIKSRVCRSEVQMLQQK